MKLREFSAVATEMSVWENVVVTPLEKAYSEEDMKPYYGKDKAEEEKRDGEDFSKDVEVNMNLNL